tara:strand:- start:2703 stop:3668 length:966 start_codon:yes stop_codon:yes gene_type:complete
VKAFISYSHADEHYVQRLHKHLAMLQREGLLESFYDRDILVGAPLDEEIATHLAESQLFIAIVSPDFIHSDYCMDRELATALQMHNEGAIRVVSVIVEPCEWKQSPLGNFLVAPKDGKAIALWDNENLGFLNVTSEIRRVVEGFSPKVKSGVQSSESLPKVSSETAEPARKYIAKRSFDKVDRFKFREEGFREIRDFFARSVEEMGRTDGLSARFRDVDSYSFTCTVMNEAFGRGIAHITVRTGANGSLSVGDISWSYEENARPNTANGWASINNNDYEQFFEASILGFSGGRFDARHMSPEQLASAMWEELIDRAGIKYA